MPVESTDVVLIERGGTLYKATAQDIADLGGGGGPDIVPTSFGTSNKTALSASFYFTFTVTGPDDVVFMVGIKTSPTNKASLLADSEYWTSYGYKNGDSINVSGLNGSWSTGTTTVTLFCNGYSETFTVTYSGGGMPG